ncbi:hypothetical protein TNCV_275811 [Trichonephila clavipes]|nr:hypothetical protein TNCV_275811 [Trichonephila clavipes]
MDTLWFRYPLVAQWETRVIAALVECQIMDVYVADSSVPCPRATCADSTCPRTTCADSSVTSPTVTCADSAYADSTYADSTYADSTYADSTYADSTYADSTCADSRCPDVPEHVQISRTCHQVPQSPVQIPLVPEPPVQLLPELDTLDPLESTDAFDKLMSFVFGPQELQLLHTVPSIFDGDLFSFLDEFERAPIDLTMPRLNSCVKKSIGFKPIQPMDLSVNSYIGQ